MACEGDRHVAWQRYRPVVGQRHRLAASQSRNRGGDKNFDFNTERTELGPGEVDDGDTDSSHTIRGDDDTADAESVDCDETPALEAQGEEVKEGDHTKSEIRAVALRVLKQATTKRSTTTGVSNADESLSAEEDSNPTECLNTALVSNPPGVSKPDECPKAAQGAKPSDAAYKRSADADEAVAAVCKLSTLSHVYEYVELARCFAPAASGGDEAIFERLKEFHENMWLRGSSSSRRNPVGRFSEAEELARAFER